MPQPATDHDSPWLERFAADASVVCESAAVADGTVLWQSRERVPSARNYESVLPAGLHIGCGQTAGMRTASRAGPVDVCGPSGIVMLCHEPISVRTEILPGGFDSAGVSVGLAYLREHPNLARLVGSADDERVIAVGMPAAVVARVAAPIDPWFVGSARRLMQEARILELVAAITAARHGPDRVADTPGALRYRRLAFAARDRLEAELAAPPTLASLAIEVGTNVRTLNVAFREVFGCSIAAWVAGRRLDEAVTLLRAGHASKAVAYRLGYTPAHFSAAFRRRFGVQPHRCR